MTTNIEEAIEVHAAPPRAVLVTGGSSGLGRRFAKILSSKGHPVAVAARRVDRLEALVREIEDAGGSAVAVPMDVCDEGSVSAGFDLAEKALGSIGGVIANAGITGSGSYATDIDVGTFAEVFGVNVTGAFLTAREGARRMIAGGSADRGDGRVLLIGSIRGLAAAPRSIAYSTSKAALNMMGMVMAREWVNQGVNVNVLCPGYIDTELTAHLKGLGAFRAGASCRTGTLTTWSSS